MKDFFKTCLEELELKTGIRQLYWLQQSCADQTDFDRKKNILLDGMCASSVQFEYIDIESQKKIILSQITKDQDYEALNSRTVWKWLNMYKDHFYSVNKAPEEIPQIVLTPEEEERIKQLSNEWLSRLAGNFSPQYGDLGTEIKRIVAEDKERAEGKKAVKYEFTSVEEIAMRNARKQWAMECHDLHTGKPKENWISFEEWIKL